MTTITDSPNFCFLYSPWKFCSLITYIHGSCKFVIDSVLLFLPRWLLEKRNVDVGDLCYQHVIPLHWIQCLSVFHWMANNLDGFWNTAAFCSTVWPRLVWSELHLYTSGQPGMAGEQFTHIWGYAVWIRCWEAVCLSPCPLWVGEIWLLELQSSEWALTDCRLSWLSFSWCMAVGEGFPAGSGTVVCALLPLVLGCAIPQEEGAGSHADILPSPGDSCSSQAGVNQK